MGLKLEAVGISKTFGGLAALDDVSISFLPDAVTGLIGPNGSGKTTLINILSRHENPDRGRVLVDGQDITTVKPEKTVELGIARTYQQSRLFPSLTVAENVALGAYRHHRTGPFGALVRGRSQRAREEALKERVSDLLRSIGLSGTATSRPTELPYGHQRLVEIARALASEPDILLLDEPAAGMNSEEKRELGRLLDDLRRRLTVVMVEHDLTLLMSSCDWVTVLSSGKVLASGDPQSIRRDEKVIQAYLGSRHAKRETAG